MSLLLGLCAPRTLAINIFVFHSIFISDMKSIREATEDIIANHSRIDVMLLNAGVMASPKRMTTANHLLNCNLGPIMLDIICLLLDIFYLI